MLELLGEVLVIALGGGCSGSGSAAAKQLVLCASKSLGARSSAGSKLGVALLLQGALQMPAVQRVSG